MAADIKRNYKLTIKGVMSIDDGNIIMSVEDCGDFNLAALCEDFNEKPVKIDVTYNEDYENPKVDEETGEVI